MFAGQWSPIFVIWKTNRNETNNPPRFSFLTVTDCRPLRVRGRVERSAGWLGGQIQVSTSAGEPQETARSAVCDTPRDGESADRAGGASGHHQTPADVLGGQAKGKHVISESDPGADLAFQWGGGVKFDNFFYFFGKGSRGPPSGKFLISKGFLLQYKAYWALFLTQYITKF